MNIDPGRSPDQDQPVAKGVGPVYWAFSLRFWRQIENFGLDSSEPKWFVSLLTRLQDLSSREKGKFLADPSAKSAWRYHTIDWNQKNIPVQRSHLDWIDSVYLENEDEYPLVQFQISTGFGRVIGFWDEKDIFNVVLLDPLHNMQPSRDYNYKVDPCNPLNCHYSSMMLEIDSLKKSALCKDDTCGFKQGLMAFPADKPYSNVVVHYLDDSDINNIERLKCDGLIDSVADLVYYGISYVDSSSE